jgi:hypothetical protein
MSSLGHPAEIVLLEYLEGSLGGDASADVRRHVASCQACRRAIAEISSAFEELDHLPTAQIPHDGWWPTGYRRRGRRWRTALGLSPLALAVVALVLAVVLIRPATAERPRAAATDTQRLLRVAVPAGRGELATVRARLTGLDATVALRADGLVVATVPRASLDRAALALAEAPGGATRVLLIAYSAPG